MIDWGEVQENKNEVRDGPKIIRSKLHARKESFRGDQERELREPRF